MTADETAQLAEPARRHSLPAPPGRGDRRRRRREGCSRNETLIQGTAGAAAVDGSADRRAQTQNQAIMDALQSDGRPGQRRGHGHRRRDVTTGRDLARLQAMSPEQQAALRQWIAGAESAGRRDRRAPPRGAELLAVLHAELQPAGASLAPSSPFVAGAGAGARSVAPAPNPRRRRVGWAVGAGRPASTNRRSSTAKNQDLRAEVRPAGRGARAEAADASAQHQREP